MEGNILVTPAELTKTAEEFRSQGKRVADLTSGMISQVNSLSSAWEGEASAAFINKFSRFQEDMEQMNQMINEHIADLYQMAEIYDDTEQKNLDDIAALAENVIS